MTTPEHSTYHFAEFELQPDERRLLQDGQPVPLTPKLFEILEFLVLRGGHVVSKEELLNALWPKRFVMESNLTKHIWMLRKALGENDGGERFIETVSKIGYRFVAPVTRHARAPDSNLVLPPVGTSLPENGVPASAGIPRWSLRAGALAALFFVCIALAAWWLWNGRQPTFPWSANPPGTVVAVVKFDNLSKDPKNAWIGAAFEEMLATEIALGGHLHTVPGELVRTTRNRLPDSDTGGFAPDTLVKLRQQLAADYVVSGSYLTSGPSRNPPVRLDFVVQDARTGMTIANFTRSGSTSDLPALVTVVGSDLRGGLGVKRQNPDDLRDVANARPPTLDVMRRVGFALDALHHYDPARARDELLQATVEAPDYAPSYVYLAQAWSALGYKAKALAAAKQAATHSIGLPHAMRLEIDAQNFEAQYKWPEAIGTLRKLAALRPDDPEVQLELVDVLQSAGKPDEALDVLHALRRKGEPIASDPRLELAEAQIAAFKGDNKGREGSASRALRLAQARGTTGFAADAELQLGVAFTPSDPKSAETMLERSLADYHSVGNPHGEALVHINIGNLFSGFQPKRGREEYQKALAQFQAIGDLNGSAAAYSDLGIALWNAGDRDGSETAIQNVLRIRTETGSIEGQAWALAALAAQKSDERASDEAIAAFQKAAALDASIQNHSHRAFVLSSSSDLLRDRGDFAQAQALCFEAVAEYAKIKDVAYRYGADYECALISLDRGDLSTAATSLQLVRKAAAHFGDTAALGDVDRTQGQISMGNGDWAGAVRFLSSAAREYAQGDTTIGEAVTLSLLALCDSALGKTAERDAAVKRAVELRDRITERQSVFQVDIALTELRGETGEMEQATSHLEALASDARSRLWPGWALEAELAELRVLRLNHQTSRAAVLRARIAAEARQEGFIWILERAQRS